MNRISPGVLLFNASPAAQSGNPLPIAGPFGFRVNLPDKIHVLFRRRIVWPAAMR